MDKKVIIECRYEMWSYKSKHFCDWYIWESTPMTEEEANDLIKRVQKEFADIEKKSKSKHEYRLKDYDEYLKEEKVKEADLKKLIKHQEEYYKSDQYKELQRKKRISAKERKEKQKKYLEEHDML